MQKFSKAALVAIVAQNVRSACDTNCASTCTNTNECAKCKATYVFNKTYVCTHLAAANCETGADGTCTACKTGFTETKVAAVASTNTAYSYCASS